MLATRVGQAEVVNDGCCWLPAVVLLPCMKLYLAQVIGQLSTRILRTVVAKFFKSPYLSFLVHDRSLAFLIGSQATNHPGRASWQSESATGTGAGGRCPTKLSRVMSEPLAIVAIVSLLRLGGIHCLR